MAKRQSFADKANKKKSVIECPVCKGPVTPTMFILPLNAANGSVKLKRNIIGVCKCNYKQYYG
jgi:hypothetical protein